MRWRLDDPALRILHLSQEQHTVRRSIPIDGEEALSHDRQCNKATAVRFSRAIRFLHTYDADRKPHVTMPKRNKRNLSFNKQVTRRVLLTRDCVSGNFEFKDEVDLLIESRISGVAYPPEELTQSLHGQNVYNS